LAVALIQPPDEIIVGIREENIAGWIGRQAGRAIDPGRRGWPAIARKSRRSGTGDGIQLACGAHHLYARVRTVGNEQLLIRVNGDANGALEGQRKRIVSQKAGDVSVRAQAPDALVAFVSDISGAIRAYCNRTRKIQSGQIPRAAVSRETRCSRACHGVDDAVGGNSSKAIVAGVGDQQRSKWIQGDRARRGDLRGRRRSTVAGEPLDTGSGESADDPIRRYPPDLVVVMIGDIKVARCVDGQADGRP
jgi:hypothetical protein